MFIRVAEEQCFSSSRAGRVGCAIKAIRIIDNIIATTLTDVMFILNQHQFVVDDVSKIIKEAIETTIGGNAYQHDKVNNWTGSVVETCLSVLTKLQKPYKYIVTCMIMQKNGAGLHTASSCFWNNETDGSCTVRWENKTMYCIVSVFGLSI
ncbi:dynein light chain Tctex-type isoform X2 [Aedes albopictus]|uniref:Dynein light chain n=1 Tax=Aedes albopictus TaxID=7160 RepID=A0ABM1YGU6_AEDAL